MNNLQFVVLTIEEAEQMELPGIENKRKSIDGTKLITHIGDLQKIYEDKHLMVLEVDDEGNEYNVMPELPFPVIWGEDLSLMLSNSQWNNPSDIV